VQVAASSIVGEQAAIGALQLPAVVRKQLAVGALQLASVGEHLPLGALQLAAGGREERLALCAPTYRTT